MAKYKETGEIRKENVTEKKSQIRRAEGDGNHFHNRLCMLRTVMDVHMHSYGRPRTINLSKNIKKRVINIQLYTRQ